MAAWHRRHNVSGTVQVGDRLGDWFEVLRHFLQIDSVCPIGHITGATTVYASSSVADFVSCGREVHEFWALAPGKRPDWLRFAEELEAALTSAGLPHSLVAHDGVLALE